MSKRAYDEIGSATIESTTPDLPVSSYNGTDYTNGISFDGLAPVKGASYSLAVTPTRQTFITCKLEHDNTNQVLAQRECIFSLPSKSRLNKETLYNPRHFNEKYDNIVLTADELETLRRELLFQGVSLGSTPITDMEMKKSVLDSPWGTGSPLLDVVIAGSIQVYDSWPNATAADRLYFVLKPSEAKAAGYYTVKLVPETRMLNDPTVLDLIAVPNKPWIRGALFPVGTIADPLPMPVPDVSTRTYEAGSTAAEQRMVRDRIIDVDIIPFLC